MLDPETVNRFREHYQGLSAEELEAIALTKAATLLPEALQALRSELTFRGGFEAVHSGIDAQLQQWSEPQLARLVDQYRSSPCPRCSARGPLLNAVEAASAAAFLVYSMLESRLIVGCPACIRNDVQRLSNRSLLLGWWALMGPVHTMRALARNSQALRRAANAQATRELHDYVFRNVGRVTAKLTRLGIAAVSTES